MRRPPSRSDTFGALPTTAKLIQSAPIRVVRSGLRVQGESARRGPDPLLDERRIQAHAGSRRLDLGAGSGQDRARLRQEEVHADLGQDLQRGRVDRLDLVGGQDLERRKGVAQALKGRLREADLGPIPPWSPSRPGHSST
jgi:hypothetical protein